ncbi:MAG: hypothetical protein PHN69_00840 [Candidatus Pacebacteria bacterium]|nr:hypothetical protein [Candidatus Paceibacterota bacterium]
MFTIIGWIGMILFLVNYVLVVYKKVEATGKAYNMIQVIAAAAIAYSLLPAQAWPTIILECFFILIGLTAILKKK